MKIKSRKQLLAAMISFLGGSNGSLEAVAETHSAGFEIEEIVVTAQKRAQSLQEVPISETVLDSDDLKNSRIESGTEIARQAPNLQVSLLGNEMQPKFSMRGVSTKEFNLNGISPTGVFVDEVYIGASYLGGAQIYDIERVEVLRGPQGTLFGKNTTAGAINFISKKPIYEKDGYITGGFGSNDFWELKGAGELPIIEDTLSARLAFNMGSSDGYIENQNPDGRDLSNIDRESFRLTLGYQNGDGVEANLRLFRTESNPRAIGAINDGLLPGGVNSVGVNPRVNPYTGERLASDETATDRSGDIEVVGSGGYLTADIDLGFATLTSISSYIEGEFSNLVDADGTINNILHLDFGAEHREISQDIRLSSNTDGNVTWIAGLYYFRDSVDIDTTFHVMEEFGGPVLGQSYRQTRTSYAIYLDGTYELTESITFYGGIRYTEDEGVLEDFQVTPIVPRQSDKVRYDDGEPTGRIGIRKHFGNDSMVYAQFAYGYRSSAINGGALSPSEVTVADPEKIEAFEIGYKSQWFDRRLTLNSSVFHYDFTDQQFLNLVNIGNQQLLNAGSSTITGLEVELTAHVSENLSFNAGFGLLDSEYDKLELNGVDLSGNELIEAPRRSANIAGNYTIVTDNNGEFIFHMDANYIGSQYFHATNSPEFTGDSSWDVGARIAYRSSSNKFEVSLYGKNLTDNDEIVGVETEVTTQTRFATVPFPRRFGIDVTVNF
ncbi:TonB-dependent receptor [Pseudomaricurvus alkylphenolicus]|uniref:TonB-dependent receptor n=1 Tax=Pseudomaricurvus alkylphenolicus TaxID=1306991 RepID=UPI0014240B90|nr:TonB-dependent receptor [Pseudomaricurvus alkylphenolicus]NIB43448.1 TonB-dependent receptor [Pseudomaricurvus alkylphenolicus]